MSSASACWGADCAGHSRTLIVNSHDVTGFGDPTDTTPLPLRAHEYLLSFDDGPVASSTPLILQTLKSYCVPAVFFEVGRHAEAAPRLAAEEFADGFTIGSHTYSHPDLSHMPAASAEREIIKGYQAEELAATGAIQADGAPRLFRFPYLSPTPQLLQWLHDHHIVSVGRDFGAEDWKGGPPGQTLRSLLLQMGQHDRGIILLHDSEPNTAAMLPHLLDAAAKDGDSFVRLVLK